MSKEDIVAVRIPKWGMSMEEGTLVSWLANEGDQVNVGDLIAEVESTKVVGELEAPMRGILRRQVASKGDTLAVGALVAVISSPDVPADVIDAFVLENAAEIKREETQEDNGVRLLTTNNSIVAYYTLGSGGIPAILVHGFGGSKDAWALVGSKLSQNRMVVMPDLPGHGESSKNVGSGDIADMCDVLLALINELGIEKAHLVGHSLGGAIALAFAEAHPGKVASLSLIASAGLGQEINGAYLSAFASANRRRELSKVATQLFANPSFVTNAFVDELVRYKCMDGVSEALKQIAARCFPDGEQSATLQKRTVVGLLPSQILWGDQDRIIPVTHTDNLTNVTIIRDAGHMVHVEDPKSVNAWLLNFMAKNDNSGGAVP